MIEFMNRLYRRQKNQTGYESLQIKKYFVKGLLSYDLAYSRCPFSSISFFGAWAAETPKIQFGTAPKNDGIISRS